MATVNDLLFSFLNSRVGSAITLFPSAARSTAGVGVLGDTVQLSGGFNRFIFVLSVTAAADAAADTLDVFVDWSLDNSTWYNGVHFTQVLGNGGAVKYFTVCDPTAGLAADVAVTSDAAVHVTRPSLFGPYVRGRYTLVADGATHTFTFSLTGYAQ